jgi:multicomponent Na+:H+ antiporter subunit D
VASLVPEIRAGRQLEFVVAELLPGLRIALRADAMSMIFAVSASFLWVVTVFYSAGYMRGLRSMPRRGSTPVLRWPLFGAMGCAFADNLFTLYLFYEIVSICTYPLVAHHQDAEGYEGGKKYLVYLTATAKGLVLPAMILIYVLTGTLDFADNIQSGILPPDAPRGVVIALYACCILGFAKNGIMPFTTGCPGPWLRPPRSAPCCTRWRW